MNRFRFLGLTNTECNHCFPMENIRNIAELEKKILKEYGIFLRTGREEKIISILPLLIRAHAYVRKRDEDMTSEVYLAAQENIQYLWKKFLRQKNSPILAFFKSCANYLILSIERDQTRENKAMNQLVYNHSIEWKQGFKENSQEYEPLMESLRHSIRTIAFPWGCIFALKHDFALEEKMERELKKFFLQKGIVYREWEENHKAKRQIFYRKRERLVDELMVLTRKITRKEEESRVSYWKKKKELKLQRLEILLKKGIYTTPELAEVFGIDQKYMYRRIQYLKKKWGSISYPKESYPETQAA